MRISMRNKGLNPNEKLSFSSRKSKNAVIQGIKIIEMRIEQ